MSLLKEPLLHFLLIGGALFLLFGGKGNPTYVPGGQAGPPLEIVVTRSDIDQMTSQFAKTWQRPPTEDELKGLVEDFVRSEIFYREAIAIGLDRSDEVLKRRLRQRMEFIFEDISILEEPRDEDLNAFMKKHSERYLADPQVSFRHVYVNTEQRGKSSDADARLILARLNTGAPPGTSGDPFLMEQEIKLSPLSDIRKQFGDSFSASLPGLPTGRWVGPIRSGYGLHLVFIRRLERGRLPGLNEIREIVKRDWTADRQKELKDAAYAKIRERYTVTLEPPIGVGATGKSPSSATGGTR